MRKVSLVLVLSVLVVSCNESGQYDGSKYGKGSSLSQSHAAQTCLSFSERAIGDYAASNWDVNRDGCVSKDEAAAVSNIPANAFAGNTSIASLDDLNQFPNLTSIGNSAFAGCTNLTNANLDSVASIGDSAFKDCTNLVEANMPKASNVAANAFEGCTKLNQSVECPSSCPNDCDDNGVCYNHEVICPPGCANGCDADGNCNSVDICPSSCPNDCNADGVCNLHVVCPSECPNDCDADGVCNNHEVICPPGCANGCDADGNCNSVECPSFCPNDCNADGVCNLHVVCPENCPDDCDDNGVCNVHVECPDECPNNCSSTGICNTGCDYACVNGCYQSSDGNYNWCLCPDECPWDCNEYGVCNSCDGCKYCNENGTCRDGACHGCEYCNDNGDCFDDLLNYQPACRFDQTWLLQNNDYHFTKTVWSISDSNLQLVYPYRAAEKEERWEMGYCGYGPTARKWCTINWGDGTTSEVWDYVSDDEDDPCSGVPQGWQTGYSHTYAAPGTYTVETNCDFNLFFHSHCDYDCDWVMEHEVCNNTCYADDNVCDILDRLVGYEE